jgi:HEAT repeat protein
VSVNGLCLIQRATLIILSILWHEAGLAFGQEHHDVKRLSPEIQKLVYDLRSDSPETRIEAAEALVALGSRADPALTDLLNALGDPEKQVRFCARKSLVNIGERAVDALAKVASNKEKKKLVRLVALQGLQDLGAKAGKAVPTLSLLLKAEDLDICREAALALGHTRELKAVAALRELLRAKEPDARAFAVFGLESTGREEALEPLFETINSESDSDVRRHAVEALGWFPNQSARVIPVLAKALREKSEDSSRNILADAATSALERIGPASVPTFVDIMTNSMFPLAVRVRLVEGVRALMAYDACLIEGKRHLKSDEIKALVIGLRTVLDDPELEIRLRACDSLAGMQAKAKESIPALNTLIRNKQGIERVVGARSLFEIDPEDSFSVAVLTQALADTDKAARVLAANAMYRCANAGKAGNAIPALQKALDDKEAEVRMSVASALGAAGAVAAVPSLIKALADEDASVRFNAAGALASIGPRAKSAIRALQEKLRDEDQKVREAARRALEIIREEK